MPVHTHSIRHRAVAEAIALRDWPYRVGLIVGALVALSFIVLSRLNHPAIVALRTQLTDITAPVIQLAGAPSATLNQLSMTAEQWAFAYTQNQQLRTENTQLKRWRDIAATLQAENAALRTLMHVMPQRAPHFVTGRVIGQLANPFHAMPLLNIGASAGVTAGVVVTTEDGLVGRTIDIGQHTTRTLPLTDINSRISVIAEHSRERAIAVGQNKNRLSLKYLPDESTLTVGERIVTTGDGSLLPANIPVGVVTAITNKAVEVTPYIDWARLDYVTLIAPPLLPPQPSAE